MATVDKERASFVSRYHGALPVATVLSVSSIMLFLSVQRPDLGNYLAFSRENLLSVRLTH